MACAEVQDFLVQLRNSVASAAFQDRPPNNMPDPLSMMYFLRYLGYSVSNVLLEPYSLRWLAPAVYGLNYRLKQYIVQFSELTSIKDTAHEQTIVHLYVPCADCGRKIDCISYSGSKLTYKCAGCAEKIYCSDERLHFVKPLFFAMFYSRLQEQIADARRGFGEMQGSRQKLRCSHTPRWQCEAQQVARGIFRFRVNAMNFVFKAERLAKAASQLQNVLPLVDQAVGANYFTYYQRSDVYDMVYQPLQEDFLKERGCFFQKNYGCRFFWEQEPKFGYYVQHYGDHLVIVEERSTLQHFLVPEVDTEPLLSCTRFYCRSVLRKMLFNVQNEEFRQPVVDSIGLPHTRFVVLHFLAVGSRFFLICQAQSGAFFLPLENFYSAAEIALHYNFYNHFAVADTERLLPQLALSPFYRDRALDIFRYLELLGAVYKLIEQEPRKHVLRCSKFVSFVQRECKSFTPSQRKCYDSIVSEMCLNLELQEGRRPADTMRVLQLVLDKMK